jgi:uncharacterized repeat protein (TIGR02543 family)
MLLCGAMLVSHCTPSAFAEAQTITTADGLCEHHTEHTEDCGYTVGTPETPCAHEHTEDCYTEVTECIHEHTPECYPEETEESTSGDDAVPADTEEREPENCTHLCSEESGCITKEWNCPHEEGQHDESCGYVPAEEGTPCGYVCHICPIQDMIDALPGGEEVTGENAGEIKERLEAIDKAKEQLTDEETEQLDVSRYQDAAAALSALDGQTEVNVPMAADIGETFDDGNLSYRVTAENEVEVTGLLVKLDGEGKLEIPETVTNGDVTYTVTAIGKEAFHAGTQSCNESIKEVVLPGTLKKIDYGAFWYYPKLTKLELPDGIEEIGERAFFECLTLAGEIYLPDSITSIGSCAFAAGLGVGAYGNPSNNITSVRMPAHLQSLGTFAFCRCGSLESVEIPAGITVLKKNTFAFCTSLESVTLPEGLTTIDEDAFRSCTSLETINWPDSLRNLEMWAFTGCSKLPAVQLNDNMEVIKSCAFQGCTSLTEVTLPPNLKTFEPAAFAECTCKINVHNMQECIDLLIYKEKYPKYTFTVNLISDTGETVQIFEDENFRYAVTDSTNSTVQLLGLKNADKQYSGKLEISANATCNGTEYKVTSIGNNAFEDYAQISEIVLPDTLDALGTRAFYGCKALEEVLLPENLTMIGNNAFARCEKLAKVTWPDHLQTIGSYAFSRTPLTSAALPNSLHSIGEFAFEYCDALKNVYLPANLETMGSSTFWMCSSLQDLSFSSDMLLTEIPGGTFRGCDALTTVELPKSIIKIDGSAFENCAGLTTITLPEGLESIEATAFYNDKSLTGPLNLPQAVKSLGVSAFEECENLQLHINGSNLLNHIGSDALKNVKLVTCDDLSMYGYLKSLAVAPTEVRMMYDIADVLLEPASIGDQIYTGEEIKPEVKLYVEENGEEHFFELDRDYTVAYENNINITADVENGRAKIILTPTKDGSLHGGPREVYFTILAPQKYPVVMQNSDGGTSSASPEEAEEGTKVELTATPDEGYHFVEWQVLSGDVLIENNSFIMPAAEVRIQAVFEADTYTVTLNANGGTINSGDVTSYTYGVGAVLPTADNMSYTGHTFNGWYEDSSFSGSPVTAISATDTGDKTFYAKWVPVKPGAQSYTVLVSANPEAGGTVSGGGTYTENTYVTVTAAAKEGYRFVKWTEDGSAVSDSADYAFTVTADRTLTAVFEKETSDERHEGLWVSGMQDTVPYTGAPVRQENIKVYHNSTLLQEKTEYTISYKNNKNAGTAQLIVTGKGNYKGKVTQNFIIEAIDLSRESQNSISATVATAVATGKKLKPAVTVTWNQKKLKEKKDYTLTYNTNITAASDDGYDITISGTGNYTGTITRKFRVVPKGTKLLNSAKVTGLAKSYPYQDAAENAIPHGLETDLANLTVKVGKTTLTQGTDYTVRMENAGAVGTASLIIEPAQASSYAGEKRVPVLITGTNLKTCSVTGLEKSYPYTGAPITPNITVFTGKNGTGTKISEGDYIVRYTNNTKPGKATLTVTGIAEKGYSGTLKATYTISRTDLAEGENAGKITVQLPDTASYAKGGAKPQPVIRHTEGSTVHILRENIDYKLIYKNNTAVSAGNTNLSTNRQPAVTITGIGNYRGTITKTFTIVRQDISLLTIAASDKPYSAKKKGRAYYSAPKVYDLDGKQLRQNTDYTVRYTDDATGSEIGKTDIVQNGTKIRVTITAAETSKSGYSGTLSTTYFVRGAADVKDIAKAKTDKIKPQHYTGSPICPKVGLYTTKGKTKTYLTEGEDYEIVGCYNNIRKGTATILIKGKGSFSGIRTVTFKIISADNPLIWSGVF